MRITRIARRKRKQNRCGIYIDGKLVLEVSNETLLKTRLRKGDEIGTVRLKEIEATDRLTRARASALHLLSYRARSVREMQDRLRKKGFAVTEIRTVVDDLRKTGMLDDDQLARMFLRDELARRPAGRKYLKHRLRLHGIPSDLAEEAIDEITAMVPEEESARIAARKYLKTRRPRMRDSVRLRNGLAGHLSRRGFSWNTIREILNDLLHSDDREV